MGWPKIIDFHGVMVPVDSWAELKEAIQELGPNITVTNHEPSTYAGRPDSDVAGAAVAGLSHGDRALLIQLLEAGQRGVLTSDLGQALGKKGKGVRPALDRWSHKIGLVHDEGVSAFESVKRFDGRGFRMTDHFRRTAASMLGRPSE